jgi:O-antigen/teichoic acid export membrane protein
MKLMLRAIVGAQFWQAISLLCVTATQLAVAKWLGPTALGVSAMIISGASLCTLVTEANLQSALVRSISGASSEARALLARNALLGRIVVVSMLIPIIGVPFALFSEHSRSIIFI